MLARSLIRKRFLARDGRLASLAIFIAIAVAVLIFILIALLQSPQITPRRRPLMIVAGIIVMIIAVAMALVRPRAIPAIATVIRRAVITARVAIYQPAQAVVEIGGAIAAIPIFESVAAVITTRTLIAVFHSRLAVVVIAIAVAILIIGCATGERGGGEHWKQQSAKHDAIPFDIGLRYTTSIVSLH